MNKLIKYFYINSYKFLIHLMIILLLLFVFASIKNASNADEIACDYQIKITDSNIANKPLHIKPKILIFSHNGGKELNHEHMKETIKAVIDKFDIIKNKQNIEKLIYETVIVETRMGKAKYDYASKNYHNYGLAQIRVETAEDLKHFLKKNKPLDYKNLMSLRNNRYSEKDNLLYNVPYSIAVCGLYYIRRDKNIQYKINTLSDRAKAWKKHYNTYKGMGTVAIYEKRVKEYY